MTMSPVPGRAATLGRIAGQAGNRLAGACPGSFGERASAIFVQRIGILFMKSQLAKPNRPVGPTSVGQEKSGGLKPAPLGIVFCLIAGLVVFSPMVQAFSFDDLEKIEKEEQADRKRWARQAEERARREREEQQERAAATPSSSSGGSSQSGSNIAFVMVKFDLVGGPWGGGLPRGLQISGGPGRFSPSFNDASAGSIHRGYNGGLAGSYSWSGGSENRRVSCSGSFNLSGTKANLRIAVYYDSCRDAGSMEY